MQTYVDPASERLRSITAWAVTDQLGPIVGVVRFVGVYEDAPHRLAEPPHIVYGPPVRELTCQGASLEETLVVTVEEHDQIQIARSLLRSAAVNIGIPNLLAGLPGLIAPHAAAMTALKAAVTAQIRWEAKESFAFTTNQTRKIERTVKVSVSEAQDEEIVVLPQYHRFAFPVYLSYMDFLFIDYSKGKKRVLPERNLPERRHKRLFSHGRPVRNEIHLNALLGTIEYFSYVDSKYIYKRNLDPASLIDPRTSTLQVGVGPVTDERPVLPISLYEIAKSNLIPKWRDQAREELQLA